MRFGCNLQQEGNCYGAESGMLNCKKGGGVLATPGRQKKKRKDNNKKMKGRGSSLIGSLQASGCMHGW